MVTLSNEPKSPEVFSDKECNGGWMTDFGALAVGGVCYGHTGLIISVKDNGDGSKTVTTMEGWNGASPIAQKIERTWRPGQNVDFLYLGDVMK
jgi:hypothetical protein